MAMDKSGVQSTMNQWISKLNSAADACTDAATDVGNACEKVEDNWKGLSGDAMAQALAQVQQEIKNLSAEMSGLAKSLEARRDNIVSAWTEPEESGE